MKSGISSCLMSFSSYREKIFHTNKGSLTLFPVSVVATLAHDVALLVLDRAALVGQVQEGVAAHGRRGFVLAAARGRALRVPEISQLTLSR